MTRHNHRLDLRQSMQLAALMEKEFVAKCLSDKDFAKYAEDTLKFKITDGNVRGIREPLDIPSFAEIVKGKKELSQADRLSNVEKELADLKTRFEKLHEQLGGPTL